MKTHVIPSGNGTKNKKGKIINSADIGQLAASGI